MIVKIIKYLNGYHLTDAADRPAQWVFPSFTIPANGQRVVFASGKNRREPGAPLPQSIERLAKQVIWLAEAGMPLMPEVVEGVVVLPEVLERSGRGGEMPPVPPPRGIA